MGKKRIIGICRLCGKEKELSKEHIPPRSCFNKNTTYYSIPILEYYQLENPLQHKFKGKKFQGGIGEYSLCRDCNSFLGTNYVNSYKNWVNIGFDILGQGTYDFYKYQVFKIEPLKILKQIISMFLSINDDWYFEEYPELSDFVRNPESNSLPEKFQVFSYLNNEGNFRHIPHQIISNNGLIIKGTEITFPPYGYMLTFDSVNQLSKLNNITGFKNFSLDEEININLEMFRLPTYYKFLFDYRSKDELGQK